MRDETDDTDLGDLVFDPDVAVTLRETADVSGFDVRNLEELGIASFETEHRNGQDVVTSIDVNVKHLASMTTEFSIVERQLGDRWELGSWNPDVRVR